MKSGFKFSKTFWIWVGIAVVILAPFILFGRRVDEAFGQWIENAQNLNLWLVASILAGLLIIDIVAPVPSSLVSTVCGMLLGFWGGLAVSFAGMTLASMTGYGMGRWASGVLRRHGIIKDDEQERMRHFYGRYGLLFLIAMRPVPMMAEGSVLFAGVARLSPWKTWLALGVGNVAVSAVYAWVGVKGLERGAFLMAFGAAMLVAGGMMVMGRIKSGLA